MRIEWVHVIWLYLSDGNLRTYVFICIKFTFRFLYAIYTLYSVTCHIWTIKNYIFIPYMQSLSVEVFGLLTQNTNPFQAHLLKRSKPICLKSSQSQMIKCTNTEILQWNKLKVSRCLKAQSSSPWFIMEIQTINCIDENGGSGLLEIMVKVFH